MGRRERRRAGDEAGQEPRRRRQRRDWESPGAVVKGPPITVSCECGEKAGLAYGEQWSCPSCGRSYDTTRIPREQYEEIRRLSLRYRALPVGFALGVALLAIFFTLTGNYPGVFFLLPVALIVWFVFLRPVHRKRYRQAIGGLPRWQLRAD
jgi:hypothetical protein